MSGKYCHEPPTRRTVLPKFERGRAKGTQKPLRDSPRLYVVTRNSSREAQGWGDRADVDLVTLAPEKPSMMWPSMTCLCVDTQIHRVPVEGFEPPA